MRLSVIVSTYNQPAWLEKVLHGYAVQTDRDFELLVADDGSGPDTAAVVRRFQAELDFPLHHVWHEDRGYRRSLVLNRAAVRAAGDWLVFSDGDCVPRRDFVATHRHLADPGHFLSGGYIPLSPELSALLSADDIRTGRAFELRWLRALGLRPGRRALRLPRARSLATTFDTLTPTRPTFNLSNASLARTALLATNGMEKEMRYGGADRALGERLANLGFRGKQVRYRAVLLHLHHARPYRTRESIDHNRAIIRRIRERGETRARDGIAELEPDTTTHSAC